MKSKFLLTAVITVTMAVIAFYPWLDYGISRVWSAHSLAAVTNPDVDPVVPDPDRTHLTEQRPAIEVVFVLDTTSSMAGLIDAAKENIWSIASTMATGKPAPRIKMGLVAFRDRGDDYVTQVTDLSEDLDSLYATLMDLQAEGGGDGPESVNQALYEAVQKMSWSQPKGQLLAQMPEQNYRVIFLVGDAPPHMDYANELRYPEIVRLAASRGIAVNTIQAGNDPQTRQTWQHIAQLNQGEFLQVASSGDAISVTTPFDHQLALLSRALDETRLFFGAQEEKEEFTRKIAATEKLWDKSSVAAQAKRARYNISAAGAASLLGENELVDAVASGRMELDELAPSELPEPLQSMSKPEQKALLEEKASQRQQLRQQIQGLVKQRQTYIEDKLASTTGTYDSLDHKLHRALKAQAAEKGISYEATPVY